MRDSFGREITYLRISVTDRCNLRCFYCMPEEGIPLLPHESILSYEAITEIARAAAGLGITKIRLTGGEPLVRKDFPALVSMLRGVPGIETLAMTTNGTLLAPTAIELERRGLASVNVSLDTLDPDRFRRITRGGNLQDVLDGVDAALRAGLRVKLNVVVGEDSEKDLASVKTYAERIGVPLQTIARYRLDRLKADGEPFDRPPPCSACNRLRLLADGTLRPCLHGDGGIKVDLGNIGESLRAAAERKPLRGTTGGAKAVSGIGG